MVPPSDATGETFAANGENGGTILTHKTGVAVVSNFESWQILLGAITLFVTVGLAIFGKGFTTWANQLKEITSTVDKRLATIASDYKEQAEKAEFATKELRNEFHALAISMERRMSRMEAKELKREWRESET